MHLNEVIIFILIFNYSLYRVANGPGISGNLEKSENFNAKLGKVREFYLGEMNIAEVFFQDSFKW